MTPVDPRPATHEEAFQAAADVEACYGFPARTRRDERFGWVVAVRAAQHELLPAAWDGVLVHREVE